MPFQAGHVCRSDRRPGSDTAGGRASQAAHRQLRQRRPAPDASQSTPDSKRPGVRTPSSGMRALLKPDSARQSVDVRAGPAGTVRDRHDSANLNLLSGKRKGKKIKKIKNKKMKKAGCWAARGPRAACPQKCPCVSGVVQPDAGTEHASVRRTLSSCRGTQAPPQPAHTPAPSDLARRTHRIPALVPQFNYYPTP